MDTDTGQTPETHPGYGEAGKPSRSLDEHWKRLILRLKRVYQACRLKKNDLSVMERFADF